MKYVIAKNCNCASLTSLDFGISSQRRPPIELGNLAYITNEDGLVLIFTSKEDAKSVLEKAGEDFDDVLIIPYLECALLAPMEAT